MNTENENKNQAADTPASVTAGVIPPDTPPSQKAQELAAQLWCLPTTEKIVMEPELCIEVARLIDRYCEALIWCSGSSDFAPGGCAYEGFKKICLPLL